MEECEVTAAVSDVVLEEDYSPKPLRRIVCANAITWLNELEDDSLPGSIFTSLPDISELPSIFGGLSVSDRCHQYKAWFQSAVELIFKKLKRGQFAIFLQSDVRLQSKSMHVEWIDKGHICATAADRQGATCMWHKLVLVTNMSKRSFGRPTYSHLICFRKGPTEQVYPSGAYAIPDIFDRGLMLWPKAIGLNACLAALTFLRSMNCVSCVVDPFCGIGTVPAMANTLGLSSIGIEISSRRCRKSVQLNLYEQVAAMELGERSLLGFQKKWRLFKDFDSTTVGLDANEAADEEEEAICNPRSPEVSDPVQDQCPECCYDDL